MRPDTCASLDGLISRSPELYVLIVSEQCSHCHEVLEELAGKRLTWTRPYSVVNTDVCNREVDLLAKKIGQKIERIPVLLHFVGGRVVRRAEGVEAIVGFERRTAAPAAETHARA